MSWKGKAFIHHMNDDYQQSGQIVEEISPGLLLVRIDRINVDTDKRFPAPEMFLVKVEDMVAKVTKDGNCDHPWEIFESYAKLNEFLDFLEKYEEDETTPDPYQHQVN
jgi:hypothetical protein